MEASSGSAPRFGVLDATSSNDNRTINLDDIFSDCFFGPVGEVVASTSTDGPSQQQGGGLTHIRRRCRRRRCRCRQQSRLRLPLHLRVLLHITMVKLLPMRMKMKMSLTKTERAGRGRVTLCVKCRSNRKWNEGQWTELHPCSGMLPVAQH